MPALDKKEKLAGKAVVASLRSQHFYRALHLAELAVVSPNSAQSYVAGTQEMQPLIFKAFSEALIYHEVSNIVDPIELKAAATLHPTLVSMKDPIHAGLKHNASSSVSQLITIAKRMLVTESVRNKDIEQYLILMTAVNAQHTDLGYRQHEVIQKPSYLECVKTLRQELDRGIDDEKLWYSYLLLYCSLIYKLALYYQDVKEPVKFKAFTSELVVRMKDLIHICSRHKDELSEGWYVVAAIANLVNDPDYCRIAWNGIVLNKHTDRLLTTGKPISINNGHKKDRITLMGLDNVMAHNNLQRSKKLHH